MWLLICILVERVADALVEKLFWVLRPSRSLWPRLRVRQPKLSEKRPEIVRVVLDIELLVEKMLNLL